MYKRYGVAEQAFLDGKMKVEIGFDLRKGSGVKFGCLCVASTVVSAMHVVLLRFLKTVSNVDIIYK